MRDPNRQPNPIAGGTAESLAGRVEEEHVQAALEEDELNPDPFAQFRTWLEQAKTAGVYQPLGMTVATADARGRPSARLVLLRGLDDRGFVFFTNYQSRKARELDGNPWAALVFYWPEQDRQVRVEGRVERVTAEESDAYFRTRPHGSQLGAWASPQSQVIADRSVLEDRVAELAARYGGKEVPRPPHWGGFRVVPESIEIWQGRPNRLHDRLRYRRGDGGNWLIERLAP
jgi:pyridoxamine 5'-phosphate oxidase